MSILDTSRPVFWSVASLAAALPNLPMSRTARVAASSAIAGVVTGAFVHSHMRRG